MWRLSVVLVVVAALSVLFSRPYACASGSAPALGTIAYAKQLQNGQSVALPGKVVTAVFYKPGSQTIDFLYVEERADTPGPDGKSHRFSGIRVIPPAGTLIGSSDVVDVSGTVYGGSMPECYVSAATIVRTGTAEPPSAAGMSQRVTAGSSCGLQRALYRRTDLPQLPVFGMNPVGVRMKSWGKLLWGGSEAGHYVYYLDDGSGLRSCSTHVGFKVISWSGNPVPGWQITNPPQFVEVTGILSAQLGDGNLPVPVLLVDPTPPPTPLVNDDGTSTQYLNQLHFTWSVQHPTVEIARYDYAIGTAAYPALGWNNVRGWTSAGSGSQAEANGLALAKGTSYYISMRAINEVGTASPVASSDGITVDNLTRTISGPSAPTFCSIYDRFESTFNMNQSWTGQPTSTFNPFCPKLLPSGTGSEMWRKKGIYVDAIITKPDGSTFRWPCFYDYSRGWKLRFAPTAIGNWSYQIEVRYRTGSLVTDPIDIVRTAPAALSCVQNSDPIRKRGFLRRDANDCRFLSFSGLDFSSPADDTVFYPFGVKCDDTTDLNALADNGGTYSRLFRAGHMLEQQYTAGDRTDNFQETDAGWWDTFIETARNRGVYLMYLVNDWTRWNDTAENPYLQEHVAADISDTFAGAQTREVFKRKLRWMLARYGYSTGLIGFDLINECQKGSGAQDFHNDMAAFIQGDDSAIPPEWPVRKNDFTEQPHLATGDLKSELCTSTNDVDWKDSRIAIENFHGYARLAYGSGTPFYGSVTSDVGNVEILGSRLQSLWQDGAVWADRLARTNRKSGYSKPFSWTEYGLINIVSGSWNDWTAAYQGDVNAQHAKDWFWALALNGASGCHWHSGYFGGDFGNGSHWQILRPLYNYLAGTDMRGMTQESYYPGVSCSVFGCSNSLVGIYGLRGYDKAYLYVKNLTNTWYYAAGFRDRGVPTPASQSATITVKGLTAGTYCIERWSTTDTNPTTQRKGAITRTITWGQSLQFPVNWDGSGNALPLGAATDYDWGFKVSRA